MKNHAGLVPAILAMCESTAAHGTRLRVGLDVVSTEWFVEQLDRGEETAFFRNAFTVNERAYCTGRPERFAARWAAKEATAKAIGTGFRGLRPGDIEVLHRPDGRAELAAAPGSNWPHCAHAWTWALTLCHEGDAALAVAVGAIPATTHAPPTGPSPHPFSVATESQTGRA